MEIQIIDKKDEIQDFNNLSSLKGIRLKIFCYLLQQDEAVGVRETQRLFRLKTPSHADYHLQKLLEMGIVEKNSQNRYLLLDKYRVKSIRINVLSEYIMMLGRFWPKSIYFITYLITSFIFAIVLSFYQYHNILRIYLIISLLFNLIYASYEVRRQLKALPWDEY
ncbi:MAG: transcriptional regulator [Candidatus Heimdallarchaeota archaeon]|nr:transcriptional regulator [Candidatus Heimdallarchaeota archaeon]